MNRFLSILLVFISASASGQFIDFLTPFSATPTNRYTSENGSGSLCTLGSPCSLYVASALASSGDIIYLRRGDIYETGTINISQGVTVADYGAESDAPIMDGSEYIGLGPWTSEPNGFWSTPMATQPLWITYNGEMARQGESNWILVTSSPAGNQRGASTATLNAFNSVQSLVGTKVRWKEFDFRLSLECTISAYNSGTGVFTFTGPLSGGAPGYPFKLYNQQQFCTAQNDWYWDDATDKLFIKRTTSPENQDFRVVRYNHALEATSAPNITISDIDFQHYYRTAINTVDCNDLTINGINVRDIRTNGLWLYGNATNLTISDSFFERIGLNAVLFGAIQGAVLENLYIDEIGLQANIGWPLDTYWRKTGGSGIVGMDDANETIKLPNDISIINCTITNVGYQGIAQYGEDWLYDGVLIDTFCLKWSDGGGIHTFYHQILGAGTTTGIIRNTIVRNGIGSREGFADTTPVGITGIYLDNGSHDFLVEDCISYSNYNYGIFANWNTARTTIDGGTYYSNGFSSVFFREDRNPVQSPDYLNNVGNVIQNATIAQPTTRPLIIGASYNTATATWTSSYNPFSSGGSLSNNIYFRPMSVNVAVIQTGGSSAASPGNPLDGTFNSYSLAQWQTYTSSDVGSVVYSNFPTTEIGIDINTDRVNPLVVPSHGSGYKYMDGTSYTGTTLQPFTAVIYYK